MTVVFETADAIREALDICTDPDLREQLNGRLTYRIRVERAGGDPFALLPALDDEEF